MIKDDDSKIATLKNQKSPENSEKVGSNGRGERLDGGKPGMRSSSNAGHPMTAFP